MFPSILTNLLVGVATQAITSIAANPQLPITREEAPAVQREIVRQIEDDPRMREVAEAVEEAATPMPWYQSPVFLGSVVGIGASIVSAVWGVQVSPDTQQAIVAAAPGIVGILGGAFALVSRLRSKAQPIVASKS